MTLTPEVVRRLLSTEHSGEIPPEYEAVLSEWEKFKQNPRATDKDRDAMREKLERTLGTWRDKHAWWDVYLTPDRGSR